MGKHRTAWHLLAATFLEERKPACIELETEVPLSKQPQRADLLLIRKTDGPIDDAQAFFKLWRLMGPVALVEYKSRGRPPEPGVLHQLFGYGHQYAGLRQPQAFSQDLSLFLMVPDITPTLKAEADRLGTTLGPADGAYVSVQGGLFPTWIITLNDLADEEDNPLIGQLGSRTLAQEDRASWQWLAHFVMGKKDRVQHLEGFEELRGKFMKSELFKEMLANMSADDIAEALTLEQRLEGVSARERLEGLNSKELAEALTSEQRYAALLSMSDEDLRKLPGSFIDTLPVSVRDEIRQRLAH